MFEYTEKDVGWLEACLSPERLKPYYVQAGGDTVGAFHLYVRNIEVSTSLYGVIHVLEVGLRNRIHAKLSEGCPVGEWWDAGLLHQDELHAVEVARNTLNSREQPVTPDSIVSELSFGFWVKLFSGVYEKTLWVPSLSRSFPAKITRRALHDRLASVKDLRNRIAHHETLVKREPATDYEMLLETIGWISPTLKRWVGHSSAFPQLIARELPLPPPPLDRQE